MFSNYLGDAIKKYLAGNRILNGGWTLTLSDGDTEINIATAAVQRMHGGQGKTDAAIGGSVPTAGNTMRTLVAGETAYGVLTMTSADTAAYKFYLGLADTDQFPVELNDAIAANEIPIGIIKMVALDDWTPLTDAWDDSSDCTVTGVRVNGVIVNEVPSSYTFADIGA
jgi:hypothetical protein